MELCTKFSLANCVENKEGAKKLLLDALSVLTEQSVSALFNAFVVANKDAYPSLAANLVNSLRECSVRDNVLNWARTKNCAPERIFDKYLFGFALSLSEKRQMVSKAREKGQNERRACSPSILGICGERYRLPVLGSFFAGCSETLKDCDFAMAGHNTLNELAAEEEQKEREFQEYASGMFAACSLDHAYLRW